MVRMTGIKQHARYTHLFFSQVKMKRKAVVFWCNVSCMKTVAGSDGWRRKEVEMNSNVCQVCQYVASP
uniref:RL37A protein n=1 Tax=Dromaius novaehollandiae TaxID=8790 RepID=A0A8C4K621_DRONO